MEKYIIAGIKIGMTLRDGIIKTQAKDYLCDFDGEPEMKIGLSDEYIEQRHKENPETYRNRNRGDPPMSAGPKGTLLPLVPVLLLPASMVFTSLFLN